jgi:hypothetical protein
VGAAAPTGSANGAFRQAAESRDSRNMAEAVQTQLITARDRLGLRL